MSDGSAILLTIASTAVGSAASWFISRWYYRRSGTDLNTALQPLAGDTQKLLRATNLVARMLEQAGIGQPSYDGDGNLIGIAILCLGWASLPRGRPTLGFGYFSGVFLDPVLGFPG
jgi:hypothetical protein